MTEQGNKMIEKLECVATGEKIFRLWVDDTGVVSCPKDNKCMPHKECNNCEYCGDIHNHGEGIPIHIYCNWEELKK